MVTETGLSCPEVAAAAQAPCTIVRPCAFPPVKMRNFMAQRRKRMAHWLRPGAPGSMDMRTDIRMHIIIAIERILGIFMTRLHSLDTYFKLKK